VMDQRQRNFEGRSQQFWSSELPGHFDLPTVGGDWRRVETAEIGEIVDVRAQGPIVAVLFLCRQVLRYDGLANQCLICKKLKVSVLATSAAYISPTPDQQHFTISEVTADWHELMIPRNQSLRL